MVPRLQGYPDGVSVGSCRADIMIIYTFVLFITMEYKPSSQKVIQGKACRKYPRPSVWAMRGSGEYVPKQFIKYVIIAQMEVVEKTSGLDHSVSLILRQISFRRSSMCGCSTFEQFNLKANSATLAFIAASGDLGIN